MRVGEACERAPLLVLSCILFLGAVASLMFSVLVINHEKRYLSWVGVVTWAVLCLAPALVVKAGSSERLYLPPTSPASRAGLRVGDSSSWGHEANSEGDVSGPFPSSAAG